MRVIAGTHRGRRLRGPQGTALRPTSDRVREALFSIVSVRLPGCRFLDLYAGTGAIGIEAVSRGAGQVTCVESNGEALTLLRRNIADCGMAEQIIVCGQTVKQFLSRSDGRNGPYDIVFADPPYAIAQELTALFTEEPSVRLFAADARLIIEHASKAALPAELGGCAFRRAYRYGDTTLSLYTASGAASS